MPPMVTLVNNGNQIHRYSCGLDLVPGENAVEVSLMQQAIRETEGLSASNGGFRSRMEEGIYDVRRPQMSVKRRG